MRNDPYRHSVWIDVFGALLFGAVLLGGASYLLYHADRAGTDLAAEAYQPGPKALNGRYARRPPARRAPAGSGGLSLPGPEPIAGGRRAPGGEGAVPFSDSWRRQAAPELSGPSGSSGGQAQGGASESAGRPASGRSGAARRSSSRYGGATGGGGQAGSAGGSAPPSRWRAEARRFSDRARALSNQLGQIAHSSEESREETSQKEASGRASAAGASSSDRNVGDPPNVPIDDHVYWLTFAGLIWGIWRLS